MEDFGDAHPNPNLSALIGSRICHDLISPVGAISNGLELLRLTGVPDGPEMELMQASADHANGRIRFFRVAFGLSSDEQMMDTAELRRLAETFLDERIALDWRVAGDMARRVAQALCLAMLCAERALPYGGTIKVEGIADALAISAGNARMGAQAPVWALLDGYGQARHGPLAAADVQFALLPETLAGMGRRAQIDWTAESVSIRF